MDIAAIIFDCDGVLGVRPEACLVVEDSLPGVRAAQAGGFQVAAYVASGQVLGLLDPAVSVLKSMIDILDL